jgi:hypothetical protein
MKRRRRGVVAAVIGVAAIGTFAAVAIGSPPSGFVGETPLVTASLDKSVRIRSDGVRFRTRGEVDVRVQKIVITAGGSSGWHHHPGMVIVAVASGAVTFSNSRCKGKTYGPGLPNGSVFVESGDDPTQATSTTGATSYLTYIAPEENPPVFRIEDDPPRCA